jgi:predicted nucleotidyltransferase
MEQTIKISKYFDKYLNDKIPERFRENIKNAYVLLKKEGCTNVYLFGSLIKGETHKQSDIDIGIKGLPAEKFISVYSALDDVSNINIDLVDFDFDTDFFFLLNEIGRIKEIE